MGREGTFLHYEMRIEKVFTRKTSDDFFYLNCGRIMYQVEGDCLDLVGASAKKLLLNG